MSSAEAIKAVCVGFEVAEYHDERTNTYVFSDPAAFERVRLGYSCASCLARFTTYVPVCPLCGNERDVLADMKETPADMQTYWDAANGPGERTVAEPMDKTIERLAASPDVEHIPIKGLKPSRWGAGR